MLIVGYGAPGITERQLKEAVETTMSYVKQVSNGETGIIKVFSPTPK
ncbi:hypothetical protein KAU85_03795 [Candidatus Bathyarchaeota archaeon]|nr:hypothetical protein [Candidatus Bathyarchaeota archaeon]MCK4482615.1 hypothetical protein [Candidatus Bathyarchaeota archaeon]